MCCCLDDENVFDMDAGTWAENPRCFWLFLWLSLAVSVTSLILVGIATHVNHKQDNAINDDLSEAMKTETVISATVLDQYFGVTRNSFTGAPMIDHIPSSILMPKTGRLYEKAHCITEKHSPFGTIMMMKQFEVDLRGASMASIQYSSIQMRFEVPFGDVMDSETGSGYPGILNVTVERKRCGVPFCPDYQTILLGTDYNELRQTESNFAMVIGEHYVFYGGLYERVIIPGTNSTTEVYDETLVTKRITCACSPEIPPRFSCSFPAVSLNGKHGWFRLDIGFRYLLKPVTRSPYSP